MKWIAAESTRGMRRPSSPLWASVWLCALSCLTSFAPLPARVHLVLLHTNDMHGQVLPRPVVWDNHSPASQSGGLARVAAAIQRTRREVERAGGSVLVVDAGDWFQGTPEGALDDGRAYLSALASVGYDALCVGNHEFDRGVELLEEHLAATGLPALLANAKWHKEEGARVRGTRPSLILRRGGLDILLVGLLTESTPNIAPPARALSFESPAASLKREVEAAPPGVDLVLPLTHLGLEEDRLLAQELPWIEVIIGGHSHSFLAEGERVGNTLIAQVGSKASAVGRVDLWLDALTHAVLEKRASVIDLLEEPERVHENKQVAEACAQMTRRVDKLMQEPVGQLSAPLLRNRDRWQSSSAGNWICDCLRLHAGADLAVHNKGGIRSDIPAGVVTRRQLFDFAPFDNTLVTLEISGAELRELLSRAVAARAHSGLEVSGVIAELKPKGALEMELARVWIGGEPLDLRRNYRLATQSFLANGGDAYAELERQSQRSEEPLILRELLERCLQGAQAVQPSDEARWRRIP